MMILKTAHNLLPVVIPAYKPDTGFVSFISSLAGISDKIIIVDDGSGEDYRDVFNKVESIENVEVLRHAINLGKGRSLKSAFNYVLDRYPEAIGVITADADGQHLIKDIVSVSNVLRNNPDDFILGCRDFSSNTIPWKSKVGNVLTRRICAFLCGVNVSDTQTGLRGIPLRFLERLMHTHGERYEYETNMLLECNNGIHIIEIPIHTVYDSRNDHKTHFDPLRDSFTIYKVILAYSLSSILATVIDFLIFTIAMGFGYGVWMSTAVARVCAAFINFLLNKNIVFKSKGNGKRQFLKYALLVIVSGSFSALAISRLGKIIFTDIIIIKAVAEICLFFFNYYLQRSFIFAKRKGDQIEKSIFSDEITKKTNWTKYYEEKKSWASLFTQRYTLKNILNAIDRYVKNSSDIHVCEMGGGNSCFAVKMCKEKVIHTYDVIDNNELAVELFNGLELEAKEHGGECRDLLRDETVNRAKYDFVYSVGLIEHFREEDVRTMIRRHFEYCKNGGVVFITFPTPTRRYIFVRKCMEFLGVWQFHDEKPIRYDEIICCFESYGVVLEHFINNKLPLTQEVVVVRKGEI